ncbi:lactonase family protein [Sediminicola luteus]|uniref:6-phosphogluconolactonase n=1 Tax=Sediminicola luteus TaxID=319238 RepID=A0A2A4GDL6_9FLAO|nr:lactonase family protein [Sediminicola luteus]PCE66511.1 6-phosphogluconolactonase [Sediminicola luteus]
MNLIKIAPVIMLILFASCSPSKKPGKTYPLFVGTYTDGASEGIYAYTFDSGTGLLSEKVLASPLVNPSFVKISPDKKFLFAVQETDNYDSLGGAITAFKVKDKRLGFINTQATKGAHPCHIGISKTGDKVAVSNYTGGNVAIYGRDERGGLTNEPQVLDHKLLDSSTTSHAHAAQFNGDDLFVADLGLDAVQRYQATDSIFVPHTQSRLAMAQGAGPRHFTFNAQGEVMYVINELNSTLTVLKKQADGGFSEMESHATLADGFSGDSYCADIHLSPDGSFLYGSNRGENTIVIFAVAKNGNLTLVGRSSVEGDWPRNFVIDPSGNFLLVANQKSDNITVFERDAEKGTLRFMHEVALSKPVCLEFLD